MCVRERERERESSVSVFVCVCLIPLGMGSLVAMENDSSKQRYFSQSSNVKVGLFTR